MISSLEKAVMKMIGVISDCRRWRMSAAVSNPSMSGMQTSSRITAKSWAMTRLSAAVPDSASTIRYPSGDSTDLRASRFEALSSTIRMGTGDLAVSTRQILSPWAGEAHGRIHGRRARGRLQPRAEDGEELGGVDRLGNEVVGAGVEAALALARHDLAGDGDDGKRA